MIHQLFAEYPVWVRVMTALALAAGAAFVVAEIAGRVAARALVAIVRGDATSPQSPSVRRPMRIVRAAVFLAVFAALALPALDVAGMPMAVGLDSRTLNDWFFGSGLRIGIIVIGTYLLMRMIAASARRLEDVISTETAPDAMELLKRARTLSGLMQNALTGLVVGMAALMILRELRIDIMPILTGAGIVGLAVGFGAQTLVKDLIAGFFLTFENQVRVGDVATINGTGGLVEAINLRTIVLRDFEGVVHVFPNGSIERLANRTKDFSYYVIDVNVSHKEDPDTVMEVLREVGATIADDPRYRPHILEPLEVVGVDGFADTSVTIRARIKTVPLKQWDVGRELRRRIKRTFDARGIEFPTPHPVVYIGNPSKKAE